MNEPNRRAIATTTRPTAIEWTSASTLCHGESKPQNQHGLPIRKTVQFECRGVGMSRGQGSVVPSTRRTVPAIDPRPLKPPWIRRRATPQCSPIYVPDPNLAFNFRGRRAWIWLRGWVWLRGVVAARIPGMAAKNSPDRPRGSPNRTLAPDDFDRISTAGRRESTISPQQRADHDLIPADQADQDRNRKATHGEALDCGECEDLSLA